MHGKPSTNAAVSLSTSAKWVLLGSLYFSQGLPFGFFTQALPVLLRQAGFSLRDIGLASLLAIPWALKFAWAPVIDRYSWSRWGRRKSWIVPLQLTAVAVLAIVAMWTDPSSTKVLMVALFVLSVVAATQDVATDGLAVDILEPSQRGFANGLQVAGFRVGMIVGGGVLLIVHERLGPSLTFFAMAGLTAVATLPILFTREPKPRQRDGNVEHHEVRHAVHFIRREGAARVLTLVVIYKFGDAFATGMLRPFLVDTGLSLADIGWLLGTVAFIAGLIGALLGGALVNVLGRRRALVVFGFLQALTVAGYAVVASGHPSYLELAAVCAAEYFTGGLATAALFTCMMDWCSRETSATDYTVQASAVVIATGVATALAGYSAQLFGYVAHFGASAAIAVVAIASVWWLFPTERVAQRVRGEVELRPARDRA